MAFRIRFAASAVAHLRDLPGRQRRSVLEAAGAQPRHEPFRETRNRKPLRPNPLAPWELRAGSLRIFYELDPDNADQVNILAIGTKRGSRLFIAGEEILI